MALSNKALKDFHNLALKRVDEAFASVAQLMENDEQVYQLSMVVLTSLARATAVHISETAVRQGEHISHAEAMYNILATIANISGIKTTAMELP